MRDSVKTPFFDYSIHHEGFTPFMYCDTLNLVTTGIGNLIDFGPRNGFEVSPVAMAPAMALPWKHKGAGWSSKNPVAGSPLSQSEIADAWTTTKLLEQRSPGAKLQGGFKTYPGLTDATLDMQGIRILFDRTLASNEAALRKRYPNYDTAPTDAQFALNSMAWAMGASFFPVLGFTAFHDAFVAGDFQTCVTACQFKGGGLVTDPKSRNHDNAIMFQNAANVAKGGGDFDLLFFPGNSSPPAAVGVGLINKPATVSQVAVGVGLAGASWAVWKLGKAKGWF